MGGSKKKLIISKPKKMLTPSKPNNKSISNKSKNKIIISSKKLGVLCDRFKQSLTFKAYAIVGDMLDAEDVVYNVFRNLTEKANNGNPASAVDPVSYLFKCVINEAIRFTKSKIYFYDTDSLTDCDYDYDFSYFEESNSDGNELEVLFEREGLLSDALANVDFYSLQEEVLSLYMSGLKNDSIAFRLGIKSRDVAVMVYNIKKRLATYIMKKMKE